MSKPKSKPPALTNKEPPPAKAAPAARARDLDDDVFDVAHNALLRTKVVDQHSGHSSGRAAVRAEWDDGLPSKSIVTPEAMEKAGRAETERAEVQAAVDAAWAKSAELQEQAVAAARSTTSRELRERHERELREKLQEQETRLRHEAEEALKKIWETANRERDRAVEEALANYSGEKAQALREREQEKKDLEEAYQALKGEVGRVLEKQHAKNLTDAVNTAWERAAKQEEQAVRSAIEATRAEAQKERDELLGKERMQLRAEARKTIADFQEQHAEEKRADKEEIKRLRSELEQAREAALVAEHKAAAEQQKAVRDAVEAVEQIGKAAQDRAVEAALAMQAAKFAAETRKQQAAAGAAAEEALALKRMD